MEKAQVHFRRNTLRRGPKDQVVEQGLGHAGDVCSHSQ